VKTVLFVDDLVIGGGTEKLLSLYAPFFAQKGNRVYVAAKGTRKEAKEAFGTGVRFIPMGRRSGKYCIDHGLCHGYLIALFHMVYCFLFLYGVQEKSLM